MVCDRSLQTANLTQTYSFTEQMKAIGRVPKTTILEFTEVEADKNIAVEMNARLGERLYKIKRLRIADGVPLMIECTYLPSRKFFALKRPMIEQDFHEKVRVAEEEFYASIARHSDARLLEIAEGAPVLDLIRTTYDMNNEVIEYTRSVARADQFKYKVYHNRAV